MHSINFRFTQLRNVSFIKDMISWFNTCSKSKVLWKSWLLGKLYFIYVYKVRIGFSNWVINQSISENSCAQARKNVHVKAL